MELQLPQFVGKFLSRSVIMSQNSIVRMFQDRLQDRSAKMFQNKFARMFLRKFVTQFPSRSVTMFLWRSVTMFHVKWLVKSARMFQQSNARV